MDWTDLAEVTSDRKTWRGVVKMRMKKLEEWEWNLGHKWQGERVERNEVRGRVPSQFECRV